FRGRRGRRSGTGRRQPRGLGRLGGAAALAGILAQHEGGDSHQHAEGHQPQPPRGAAAAATVLLQAAAGVAAAQQQLGRRRRGARRHQLLVGRQQLLLGQRQRLGALAVVAAHVHRLVQHREIVALERLEGGGRELGQAGELGQAQAGALARQADQAAGSLADGFGGFGAGRRLGGIVGGHWGGVRSLSSWAASSESGKLRISFNEYWWAASSLPSARSDRKS